MEEQALMIAYLETSADMDYVEDKRRPKPKSPKVSSPPRSGR